MVHFKLITNYSENLRIDYREKECLLDIILSRESSEIRKQQFNDWVKRNLEFDIPQLNNVLKHICISLLKLKLPYSNEAIERFNNKMYSFY